MDMKSLENAINAGTFGNIPQSLALVHGLK
jgi:hypothetical protein